MKPKPWILAYIGVMLASLVVAALLGTPFLWIVALFSGGIAILAVLGAIWPPLLSIERYGLRRARQGLLIMALMYGAMFLLWLCLAIGVPTLVQGAAFLLVLVSSLTALVYWLFRLTHDRQPIR